MKFEDFVNKYNGKFIDFDGQFGFQCVDLMRQWMTEGLGYPSSSIPGSLYAKDIFKNFTGNQYFKKVLNGPYNAPKKGDIVFWTYYPFVTGWAGHVAVCSIAGPMQFVSFDQNWGKPNFCKFVNHSYKGVLGWLTPIK
jgi:hypothetical protein